ncbi:MAG TPA: heparan-alpha-glucosaminide N-acetyltransferase domain-containing protein [Gemmatimonadaceae bacterium]|nr:heparan-alpha-glucosaminide N-acetyltransferase domain-containing protein [Gemmatimonadaceae bacterium]
MVAASTPARRARIDSVDLLRGLVMVIMLVDHTRDFVHHDTFFFDPTDLSRTNPALFFTRWITHYCAPIFIFLSGAGSYFQLARGKSKQELSRFLITRGLWLIVLEFTVIRGLVFWNLDYVHFLGFAQVIWVFGWSMILLSVLIYLPIRVIAAFGILMIALHNLLDFFPAAGWQGPGSRVPGFLSQLWMVLHQSGVVLPFGFPGPIWFILYPLIPWLGVMAAGYAFGSVYDRIPEERRRVLIRWGLGITLGFILIRAINIYGDPSEWARQKTAALTVASFVNVTKYPPSLLFLMMTIGPAMLALASWEKYNSSAAPMQSRGPIARMLITFGRVPLFFYILQWAYAHTAGYVLSLLAGKPTWIYFRLPGPGPATPDNAGFNLAVVWTVWFVGVLLLYPLCRWYASFKARRNDWWLSYL